MKTVDRLITWLLDGGTRRDLARREAFLAGATDLTDLEYRMRELDRRGPALPPFGSNA